MLRIVLAFFILLAAVTLGIQLNKDPGYVLIAINHWTLETTVWFAVFALILSFLMLYFLLRMSQKLLHSPDALRRWFSKRRTQKAQAMTNKGFIEYGEGDWHKAKNHLIQALPNTKTPLLNYLTAARAAQKMGDHQLRDECLRQAQQSMPEAKIAVELTLAELQLANHQWEQALATLNQLQNSAPHHPYVFKLKMQLYQEVEDWPQLIALLPELKKHHVIEEQVFQSVQHNTYLQQLMVLTKQHQPEAVSAFVHALPKRLAHHPDFIAEYVRFLLNHKDEAEAEHRLRNALRKEFSEQLVTLYSALSADENKLLFAETLLKKNAHSGALHLCLGLLCMKLQLWGKAKHYLEQSNTLQPSALAYEAQGKLHEQLGEHALACKNYKQGLAQVTADAYI